MLNIISRDRALFGLLAPNCQVVDWAFIAKCNQPNRVNGVIVHVHKLAWLAGDNIGLLFWEIKVGRSMEINSSLTNTATNG
jgi:hypothetical protein